MAPSLFATLQSAAAGGYGVAAVYGAAQGAGAAVAGTAGFRSWLQKGTEANEASGDAEGKRDGKGAKNPADAEN